LNFELKNFRLSFVYGLKNFRLSFVEGFVEGSLKVSLKVSWKAWSVVSSQVFLRGLRGRFVELRLEQLSADLNSHVIVFLDQNIFF